MLPYRQLVMASHDNLRRLFRWLRPGEPVPPTKDLIAQSLTWSQRWMP